jgi:hypothetical protein
MSLTAHEFCAYLIGRRNFRLAGFEGTHVGAFSTKRWHLKCLGSLVVGDQQVSGDIRSGLSVNRVNLRPLERYVGDQPLLTKYEAEDGLLQSLAVILPTGAYFNQGDSRVGSD